MAVGRDFVRQLRQETEPLMRRVTEHVFVQEIAAGTLPRETLLRFAEQEHHYVRGIYDYFAMCVLQAPDLDMKEWFIEVAHREVGYLGLYRRFLQALGISAGTLLASKPLPGAIAATNYQFRLAGCATSGENMAAVLMIEESWAEVCRRIYHGLQTHYALPADTVAGFDIPPLDVRQEEAFIARFATTDEVCQLMHTAAEFALTYEAMFFDSVYTGK
ncbi:MAG: iron-containing redox enzyme family protein [Nitrospinae bacterium]|nr:iron-containing redox enzyme family protein [Nitrospinota bacterium]